MPKKVLLLGFLLVFGFLSSGCSTVSKGSVGVARGVKDGAKDDWSWLTSSVKKVDNWMRDNLW